MPAPRLTALFPRVVAIVVLLSAHSPAYAQAPNEKGRTGLDLTAVRGPRLRNTH